MKTYKEWHQSIIDAITDNKCRKENLKKGECKHTAEKRKEIEQLLRNLLAKGETFINNDSPVPFVMSSFRSMEECGWTIGLGREDTPHVSWHKGDVVFSTSRFEQPIVTKTVRYRDKFEKIFMEAQEKNFYIEASDDPKKLSLGFTVFNGNGITRYAIRRSDYDGPTTKDLKQQGYVPEKEDETLP